MEAFELLDNHQCPEESPTECKHENQTIHRNTYICSACGLQLQPVESFQAHDNHNRWTRRETIGRPPRSLLKDISTFEFGKDVEAKAEEIFLYLSKDSSRRFNTRKTLICACVFHAFKILGRPCNYKKLIDLFQLDKKSALNSSKFVSMNIPREMLCRSKPIDAETFIRKYLTEEFKSSEHTIAEVIQLFHRVLDSEIVNRARPQSIAAGIVYYWCKSTGKEIPIETFSNKCDDLSVVTIQKLCKDFEKYLQT